MLFSLPRSENPSDESPGVVPGPIRRLQTSLSANWSPNLSEPRPESCVKMLAPARSRLMSTTAHLLFVDDESALRSLMAERLAERGFEVAQAESGEKAVQLLDQFAFDIVITDLRLH